MLPRFRKPEPDVVVTIIIIATWASFESSKFRCYHSVHNSILVRDSEGEIMVCIFLRWTPGAASSTDSMPATAVLGARCKAPGAAPAAVDPDYDEESRGSSIFVSLSTLV